MRLDYIEYGMKSFSFLAGRMFRVHFHLPWLRSDANKPNTVSSIVAPKWKHNGGEQQIVSSVLCGWRVITSLLLSTQPSENTQGKKLKFEKSFNSAQKSSHLLCFNVEFFFCLYNPFLFDMNQPPHTNFHQSFKRQRNFHPLNSTNIIIISTYLPEHQLRQMEYDPSRF